MNSSSETVLHVLWRVYAKSTFFFLKKKKKPILCNTRYLSLVGDEEVISLSNTMVYVFSDSVFCLGKMNEDEREPTIILCMGRQIDVVQKFTTIQNFGHN